MSGQREERLKSAKETDIVSYLKKHGIEPVRATAGERVFYNSFMRNDDNNASLVVYRSSNSFYDWGTKQPGDIIDAVMYLNNCSLPDAVETILDEKIVLKIPEQEPREIGPGIEVVRTCDLEISAPGEKQHWLEGYLTQRKVNVDIAKKYCCTVFIRFPQSKKDNKKEYKFIGFKNKKGGYELRNPFSKFSTSPKYFTHIEGKHNDSITSTFEGFMDFLSFLTAIKTDTPPHETFILNGVGNITYLHETYKLKKRNDMYIDRDNAANEQLNILKNEGIAYNDRRSSFYGYKDINEALQDDFRRTKAASDCRKAIWEACMGRK